MIQHTRKALSGQCVSLRTKVHGGNRELDPKSCLLASARTPWHLHTHARHQTAAHTKYKQKCVINKI